MVTPIPIPSPGATLNSSMIKKKICKVQPLRFKNKQQKYKWGHPKDLCMTQKNNLQPLHFKRKK
jgi:hypothetical protein